jgi:acyl-CoA thioesterase-1
MTESRWWTLVPEEYRERPEFAYVADDPALPRVLLLGDSISISYTVAVRRLLTGVAAVHRAPGNCRSTRHSLADLDRYLGDGTWRVIHCNWGLHDIAQVEAAGVQQVGIEEYERNLKALFDRLAATGAALIWATTTPVPEGASSRSPADVVRYNRVAARIVAARGIAVDDLYALALPRMTELQPPRNVHFTEAGAEVLAAQVARSIRDALNGPSPVGS